MVLICTGVVVNVFEAVDVITILRGGAYEELNLSVGEALQKRSEVSSLAAPHELRSLTTHKGFSRHIHMFD